MSTIDDDKTRRLVWNIKKWAWILDLSAEAVGQNAERMIALFHELNFGELTKEELRKVRTEVFAGPLNAHMIAVCLRQIDGFARRLKSSSIWSGAVAKKGENFLAIFGSEELKDMRDVLEHAADYVVGKGRKPQLLVDPDQDWPSVLGLNKRVERITVFGKSYEVKTAILAAIELSKLLPSIAPAGGRGADG